MERLKKIGKIKRKSSCDIPFSRIGIGFEKLDRAVFDPNKAYDKVAALGVKKVRIQSGWARTEKQKGVYDFAWLDTIVEELLTRKLEPWICLCYGNPLYTPLAAKRYGAVGSPPVQTAEEYDAWLRYVDATVRHYRGKVSLYEIWNEPDCSYSWVHYDGEERDLMKNAAEYGVFCNRTAKTVKTADPDAKTIGLVLANTSNDDLAFANRALAEGAGEFLDFASFHCYTPTDQNRLRVIRNLRNLLDVYNPSIGIIQGESGAQSDSRGCGAMAFCSWTCEKQMKTLLRFLIQDLYAGVEFTSYFSTMDMIEALNGRVGDRASYLDFGYFGVLSADFDEDGRATGNYSEKISYHALATLTALFSGNAKRKNIPVTRAFLSSPRVNGNDCCDNTVIDLGFELENGDTALVYWNATDILTSTYEGTASFCVYGQKKDNLRVVDLSNGDVYAVPENMTEDLTGGGILLKNFPITDTPVMVLFGNETEIEKI